MSDFVCICLSSTIQKTVQFKNLCLKNVNRSLSYIQDASGKAVNTARVLNQIKKGSVTSICAVGKENADFFLKLAKKDELNIKIVKTPGFTRECLTLLSKNGNDSFTAVSTTELVISENHLDFNADLLQKKLLKKIKKEAEKSKAVILAGSRPSIWSESLYAEIAKTVKKAGKIFLADFCGSDLLNVLLVCTPDIIKINQEEFIKTFSILPSVDEENLKKIIMQKSKELKNIIVVTRGSLSVYASENGVFYEYPSEKINPLNTTACGDSFNAGFIYEFVKSKNISLALKEGSWCATRNAENIRPGSIK